MGDISTIIYDDRFVSLAWWCYSSIFVQIFLGRKYQNSLVKQRASVPSQKKKKNHGTPGPKMAVTQRVRTRFRN